MSHGDRQPSSLLPSLQGLPFVCPLCHGPLLVVAERYHCAPCERSYPLKAGIPDFRVFPDPYLNFAEDDERTDLVLGALEHHDLASLLDYYWSKSDVTPPALRGKFIRSSLAGEHKAQRVLRILRADTFRRRVNHGRVLEIGAGTGNFLAAATGHFNQVIGIDIAMRWLHVSRRRFMDRGLPAPALVCCCAEHLPFPDGFFDLVVSCATLEFLKDQTRALGECARALAADGGAYLRTANRYSLAKDPYVYLWGLGFLPRSLQAKYVRWRRDASYENIRTLSYRELRRLAATHFIEQELALPDIDDEALRSFPRLTRWMVKAYRLCKRIPGMRAILRRLGPEWDVLLSRQRIHHVERKAS